MSLASFLRATLEAAGLEVRLRRRSEPRRPPPIFDDPLQALHLVRGGGDAALWCPLDRCVSYNGFGYGPRSWHAFGETLREHARAPELGYAGSILERYFDAWQPKDAVDALIGCRGAPGLRHLPSHAFLLPWMSLTPEERLAAVESIVRSENRRHAGRRISVEAGYNQHGPVTAEKGRIEHARLVECFRSLGRVGWDRGRGDAMVTILRRGSEVRYLVMHGHHRAGAAHALGIHTVPATLAVPRAVDRSEASDWPQVRRGVWTERGAVGYLDHLFDFDARRWAREKGLTHIAGDPGGRRGPRGARGSDSGAETMRGRAE